ncbi:MAG: hypothetical protein IIW92_05095, partial [Lachnospiraceae bacterium]|nr:hypothetical protein [Lachnospiraceae bacterium]
AISPPQIKKSALAKTNADFKSHITIYILIQEVYFHNITFSSRTNWHALRIKISYNRIRLRA